MIIVRAAGCGCEGRGGRRRLVTHGLLRLPYFTRVARQLNKPPPNPSKRIAVGFALMILAGAMLLMLPFTVAGGGGASFRVAMFTATSAVCVTGLTVVDTATYWSPAGQFIVMALIQIGGIGIMTGASLLFLAVSRRIGLRDRMVAQQERGSVNLGDVRRVVLGVVAFSAIAELIITAVLTLRFWIRDDIALTSALWRGVFHAVSSFNNAGFTLFSSSMIDYALDPVIILTIALAVIVGGLGFPVWLDVQRRRRDRARWSLHTKITLMTTALILVGGWIVLTALEWGNDRTMGQMPASGKLLSGFFASSMRTAGFNSVDYEQMSDPSLLVTEMLMFAGGGSGSTAGGIKVTTLAILVIAAVAEFRGSADVSAYGRRISGTVQRQALTVAFAGVNVVVLGAIALMILTPHDFTETLFEAVSAFTTAGLSMNLTPRLSGAADAVVICLMYLGRVGTVTFAVALLLRRHPRRLRYPEERPLVG